MTIKTVIAAAVLSLTPVLGFAYCSGHEQQVMTCTEGSVYDPDSNTCKVVTG